jgi:hypothetical protein
MIVAVSELPVFIVHVAFGKPDLLTTGIFKAAIVGVSTLLWLAVRSGAKRAFSRAERAGYIAWPSNDKPANHLVIAEDCPWGWLLQFHAESNRLRQPAHAAIHAQHASIDKSAS